jgi:hypothetical protein
LRSSGPGIVSTGIGILGYSGYTTPSSGCPSACVTVTLPGHPYAEQRVEVFQIHPGLDPDLLVRAADSFCFCISMSGTDHPSYTSLPSPSERPPAPSLPLLDPDGLRQLAQLVARLRAAPDETAAPADREPRPSPGEAPPPFLLGDPVSSPPDERR